MPLTLLHPGLFAFGLACVSIPIILHLLKRKRRPIPWGAMRFLEQAYRKRRRMLTIEQLILLLLRCLLLVLLALGVGSLMLGSGMGQGRSTTMVIVIDNSIGSALIDEDHTALDRNKRFALRAIDELDPSRGDSAMLITGGAPARGVVVPESSDLEGVRAMIESIQPTDSALDLPAALALTNLMDADPDRPTQTALVLATGARGFTPLQGSPTSVVFDRVIALTPETKPIDNIGITHVAPTRSLVTHSGVTLPMGVRVELLRSNAAQEASSTVRVWASDDSPLGTRTVRWQPGQTSLSAVVGIATAPIKPMHARTALVKISIDDDPNNRDNYRLLALPTRSVIRVGVIDRPSIASLSGTQPEKDTNPFAASRWVRAALAPDDRFGISILNIDARRAGMLIAPGLDAIVVLAPNALDDEAWDRIDQLNKRGALVLVTPDAGEPSLGWIDRIRVLAPGLIQSGTSLLEHQPPTGFQANQTIPSRSVLVGLASEFDQLANAVAIEQAVRLNPGSESIALAMLESSSPFGLESTPTDSRGMVVVLSVAFDLSWTNLPARPMFVPMMQEIIRQGVGAGSTKPMIQAGTQFPVPAWVLSRRRLRLHPTGTDNEPTASAQDTSIAGVIALLNAQGAIQSLVVLNPDAQGAQTEITTQDTLGDSIQAGLGIDTIAWFDSLAQGDALDDGEDDGPDATAPTMLHASSPGISTSLWMFLGSGIIAGLELVLARLFTARPVESTASSPSGSPSGHSSSVRSSHE